MNNSPTHPKYVQLSSVTGTAYDDTWVIPLPTGNIFHQFELVTNLKHYETLRKAWIEVSGQVVATWWPSIEKVLNTTYGKHTEEGRYILPLAEFDAKAPQGMYITSLLTGLNAAGQRENVVLHVEFGKRYTTGADTSLHDPVTPNMKAKAWVSVNPARNQLGGGRNVVPSRYVLSPQATSEGEVYWKFENGSRNKFLQRLLIDESNVAISKVTLRYGSTVEQEWYREDIEFALKAYKDADIPADHLLLDFAVLGYEANHAIHTQDLNFVFDLTGTGAMKTHVFGYERVSA